MKRPVEGHGGRIRQYRQLLNLLATKLSHCAPLEQKWAIMLFMTAIEKADLSRITVVPGQRSGQPCIRGLRLTVWDVLDMLASGLTEDEILRDYPYLEKPDFPAVYAYASQSGRERSSR